LAYTLGQPFTLQRRTAAGTVTTIQSSATTNILAGDIVTVSVGRPPDFIEENWYKLLSGAGIVFALLRR
jgi:hypothetical protein